MAAAVTVDTSEVLALSVNIGRATVAAVAQSRAVIGASAARIQSETRKALAGHDQTWPGLAQSCTVEQTGLVAKVGFERGNPDSPPWIHEFGSVTRSPHPTLFPAAERELPRFDKALGDLAAKVAAGAL